MKQKTRWLGIALLFIVWILGASGCGESNSKQVAYHDVTIHIKYEEPSGLNYRDDAKLFVDDEEIADVECGSESSYDVTLVEGTHEIYLKRDTMLRKYSTNKIEMDVGEGDTYISIVVKENSLSGLRISKADE